MGAVSRVPRVYYNGKRNFYLFIVISVITIILSLLQQKISLGNSSFFIFIIVMCINKIVG